jgi:hypothetical protein
VDRTKLTVLVNMARKSQEEFLAEWLALWDEMGDSALDAAMMLMRVVPEESKRVDDMLRLSFRLTMLMSLVAKLGLESDNRLNFDPPQDTLDEMRAVFLRRMHKGKPTDE